MNNEIAANEFQIPEMNLGSLKDKLAKLNRKATKLGLSPIVLTVGDHFDKPIYKTIVSEEETAFGTVRVERDVVLEVVRYFNVTVEGETPSVAGYTFAAALEHVEGEVLLRCAPSFEGDLPKSFRTADPYNCDHCHTRRTRHETFVVRHDETGAFKQIGRNCLGDFLGGQDPKHVAAMAELLWDACETADAESEGGYGAGCRDRLNTSAFLSFVAACIRKDGWMSRSRAQALENMQSTVDQALGIIYCRDRNAQEQYRRNGYMPTDADRDLAEKSLGWARETFAGKDANDRSDYEHNVYVATKGDTVRGKSTGIVGSIVAGYQRHLNQLLERQLEIVGIKDSVFMGAVGERVDFYAQLYKLHAIEGEYGTTFIHKFKTREGNCVVWFASNRPVDAKGEPIDPGVTEYMLTGTVKKHEVYKDIKQTTMTRCVVWTDEARAAHEAKQAKKAERAAKKAAKEAAKAEKAAA